MKYQIKAADLTDSKVNADLVALTTTVFGRPLAEDKLRLNTGTRNGKTVFLAAYDGDQLAAANCFIGHELQFNNQTVFAHQSCWSATSPDYRKQGLFTSLINHAKERLKASGSAFIFGFPNSNSGPIFIHKLGFRQIEMKKLNIPVKLFPSLMLKAYLNKLSKETVLDLHNTFVPVESEVLEWKQGEYGGKVKVVSAYNNFLWGTIRERSVKGMRLRFFVVGGIQVNKPHLLPGLLNDLTKKEQVDIVQLVGVEQNRLWQLFKHTQAAEETEPLIVFDLNQDTNDCDFNFFLGMKDAFS